MELGLLVELRSHVYAKAIQQIQTKKRTNKQAKSSKSPSGPQPRN